MGEANSVNLEQNEIREALVALYPQLRRIAQRMLSRERVNHTLQPTALVHEAVCRLLRKEAEGVDPARVLFYGIREMKTILIDSGRRNQIRRRAFEGELRSAQAQSFDLEDLVHYEICLSRLEKLDPRAALLLDYTFYAGLSVAQAAALLGVSERTATSDLQFAKRWLAVNWLALPE